MINFRGIKTATKCTGAEFKAFLSDKTFWRESNKHDEYTYHDDEVLIVNDVETGLEFDPMKMVDSDRVTIEGGIVYNPTQGPDMPSLEAYFKRWRKAQTTRYLVVEAPIDKLDEIREALKALGAKVLSE